MKRFPLPDLLKGLAAIFMVQIHITELFLNSAGRESLFGITSMFLGGPFAAMIFMMVMGYFMAKSKKSFGKNSFRGVKIFIVGLLLNIGLNFNLLLKIKYAGWQYNPLEYIFGVDILYLAGLSIIFISIIKTLKKGQALFAIVFALFVLVFTAFMNEKLTFTESNYVLPFIAGNYSWAYFPLFPWLAYPLIGFSFSFWEQKIQHFIENNRGFFAILLFVIAVLIILFGASGISTTTTLPAYYHHTFWFSLWAIGVVILWVVFLRFLLKQFPTTYIGNFLIWLGKNITLFYIIQWLIIGNIATAIYQTQSISTYVFWFAGIFSVTVLLTWLFGKTNIKLAR